ncbi:hypothetical protein [Aurantiacibacter xanthus]|uniref:hypothetical protein n=1 Tax=Aurantiacibacter xanthus TaxID=1784712 RepID=UPI0011C232EB|nr:hypothetical protein [Aurantiacibacter xanthus]
MATEQDIALGVMQVASNQPSGIATFKRCYKEVPNIVQLDATNLSPSQTRNGEPMWHQIVRNIKSHDISDTNFIAKGWLVHLPRVGYQITAAGRAHLGT